MYYIMHGTQQGGPQEAFTPCPAALAAHLFHKGDSSAHTCIHRRAFEFQKLALAQYIHIETPPPRGRRERRKGQKAFNFINFFSSSTLTYFCLSFFSLCGILSAHRGTAMTFALKKKRRQFPADVARNARGKMT